MVTMGSLPHNLVSDVNVAPVILALGEMLPPVK